MQDVELKEVYNNVWQHLKDKFDNDLDFQDELHGFFTFYARKFILKAKNTEQQEYIEKNLYDLVKSQFFQGYYVMKVILADQETELPEEIWALNPGIVRNEVPILMDNLYQDNPEQWYQTDVAKSIGMELVKHFDDVYELLRQMRKDIALYGAFKVFIEDDRYQNTQPIKEEFIFGNPFDLLFLNPQIYMQAQFKTGEQEIWDLYWWSATKQSGAWIGSIQLSSISTNEEQSMYLLQFSISETVVDHEKYEILNTVMEILPDEIKALLQTRVLHVREFEVLIPN
jgi:hypothetical protein